MEKETNKIKTTIYIGMSIFNLLKDSVIKINDDMLSLEDKKYLSLYFGLIKYEEKDENLLNIFLTIDKYIFLYNNYFSDILNKIDFNSMENYISFLNMI